jgi:ATP-dependent helicase/nuclease subunit B
MPCSNNTKNMSHQLLLTGPHAPTLESHVFDTLVDDVGPQPESILCLIPQDYPRDATRDRWRAFGSPAALRIDTFDDFVFECYERDQYKGRVTHIDQSLLSRLVELGVEGITSTGNPLNTGDRFPRSGLIQEAQELFTKLEFAGLLSPEEMRHRLEEEGMGDRAAQVEELATGIESARTEVLDDELSETFRTEQMGHVTTMSSSLEDVFPSIDAVVISGFTRFDVLEMDLLERIVETWPTVALLPLQVDSDSAVGVDSGVTHALQTYRDLDFSYEYHDENDAASTGSRQRITRNLYRHPEESPTTDDIDVSALDLTCHAPETVPDELRDIARDIRTQLTAGTDPGDIGIVLTNPDQYTEQVQETFETYNIPFSTQTETPLSETAVGDAVRTICQLAREPRSFDSLLHLLTNPLVAATHEGTPLDHRNLTRVAARAETNRLDTALDHIDDEVAATIESLLHDASALSAVSLDSLSGELYALLERLGVTAALADDSDLSATFRATELRARDSLDNVFETLALTESMADPTVGDSVDRLERALSGISVRHTGHPPDESVVVCTLAESVPRDFERVYLLGLTSTHFPSDPNRTAFTRSIYDAHPDFEQTDVAAEARYHFGALLSSETSLHLSSPQRSVSGEPYVEADVLTELRRVVDLSEVTPESSTPEPGYQEDVQWSIGEVLGKTSTDQARDLVGQAVEADTFDGDQRSRIEAGTSCAAARASPELTEYDGQLTTETVSQVHSDTREPYSASRLERYGVCGFKYYMKHVLDIEAPESLTREPDAGTRGSYIHDVLERYYLSLQSTNGEPVDPSGDFQTRQERLLEVAFKRLDQAFDEYSTTGFQAEWLTKVLAGLGTPETNRYYGPGEEMQDDRPVARGLFYRFLEHEFDEPAKTTARPTWFEARIGNPYDAGTPMQDDPTRIETPQGSVPIHGLIDRLGTVPGTDPTQVVVRDYKTGSNIPSESDALLGLKFQLPMYALMAEDALGDVETVGGAYYQVSPPSSTNSRSGLLTSQERTTYHGSDEVETPLLRHSYPHFETHDAFRRFIEETTPQRLGELASGITEGRFHPTVLDPSDAGCRYCDYAHVCDVRSHQRRDVIDAIDETGIPAYIPPKARDQDVEDVVEAE